MKQYMKPLLTLFIFSLLHNLQGQKKATWSEEDRKAYAHKNEAPEAWDVEMFKEDLEGFHEREWPTNPAISDYPSPVADYDWGYCLLYNLSCEIGGKTLKGKCIGNATDRYRPLADTADFYQVKFNILYLTDRQDPESGSSSVVSRNYPHYLSTGKQKTTMGEIDWVQMDIADGHNFAIINQRYFDLAFGRTVVVIPQKDGSLRFLQLDTSIASFGSNPFTDTETKKVQVFYEELAKHSTLLALIESEESIDSK